MLKVLDKLPVGNIYCVSVEGDLGTLKKGLKLIDEKGNKFEVLTVGMTHYRNAEYRMNHADIVLSGDVENIGETLYDGYWKGVPEECIEEWTNIFLNSTEGPDLSVGCPVCHHKELHRYYQTGRAAKVSECADQSIIKSAEWQWCGYCRTYEHAQVMAPDWWIPKLEIDGNKLTVIPEILDVAYRDEKKVNRWRDVPEQYLKPWEQIFHENCVQSVLNEKCPVCNNKMLRQYYTLDMPGPVRYKKKLYKGQGAHWEWCAACFRYKYSHLNYIPLDWDYELDIEPWTLMTIPEPINERMNSDSCACNEAEENLSACCAPIWSP